MIVFDILTGVAICILVKNGKDKHEFKYFDISYYLAHQEKLRKLAELKSVCNVSWSNIAPDINNDWINQRVQKYSDFISIDPEENVVFKMKSLVGKIRLDSEDLFYYTYAVLNSNFYKEEYKSDLKKQLPRIPKLKNKEKLWRQLNKEYMML